MFSYNIGKDFIPDRSFVNEIFQNDFVSDRCYNAFNGDT